MKFYNFHPDLIGVVDTEFVNKSSSLFFYALLDGHPEIVCGFFSGYPKISKNLSKSKLARHAFDLANSGVFWDIVKPIDYPFSFKFFEKHFNDYIDEFGVSNKTVYVAIYYSIAKLQKKKISKIKWICSHNHNNLNYVLAIKREFKKFKLIVTLRDTRDTAWSDKKTSTFPVLLSISYYLNYNLFNSLTNNILYVRHEDIHLNYNLVRNQLSDFLDISDDIAFDNSTVFGELWDGTINKIPISRSNLVSSKPDPKFVRSDWKENLSKFELFILQKIIFRSYLKRFNYSYYKKSSKSKNSVVFDYTLMFDSVLSALGLGGGLKSKLVNYYRVIKKIVILRNVVNFMIYFVSFIIIILVFLKKKLILVFSKK